MTRTQRARARVGRTARPTTRTLRARPTRRPAPKRAPEFASLDAFADFFAQACTRRVEDNYNQAVWCPRWREHPEAVLRLTALWKAREHLRTRGAVGMSAWWLDHVGPHMRRLLDPNGPFKYCSIRNGHKDLLAPLPVDLELLPAELSAATTPAPGDAFGSVTEFVHTFLIDLYRRQVTDTNEKVWCPQWWCHREARERLALLWHTYEYLRRGGPLGLSTWLLDHADHHMPDLFDPRGVFSQCAVRHREPTPLPTN
ncbi:DUF4913 domain-containing protein, partial [Nocardia suismassiliense]|uniref:DUF4913 domain-containing protein n=1 Tax=Nocardia suismassiliense TaxID=2077092 RepID=UPI001F1B61DD